MDVNKTLRELHKEKRQLDLTIAALESRLRSFGAPKSKRGRKSMSPEERQEVSRRMTKYWQTRRASNESNGSGSETSSAAAVSA